MNKQNILNTAKNIFRNLHSVNENLYKAELYIDSEKPAGIYYLDFSSSIKTIDFNSYQETLLASEYFNNPGALQWNYYLLLFQEGLNAEKKREIEKNDKFARKFVLNESEFETLFQLKSSNKAIAKDIVQEWKTKLDESGLHEVYGSASIASSIDRFHYNQRDKSLEKPASEIGKDILKIQSIDKIVLNANYRPYPKTREFEFKKVNLFRGINGVGKTSLFEAIELMVCGKTFRNPERPEPTSCVTITFNKSIKETFTPGRNDIYRSRDAAWYSSNYPTKNYLDQSFNRYNFFNSDAAYDFSYGKNETEIRNALLNLVLGQEYNYIKTRAEKFYGYIKNDHKKLEAEIARSKVAIEEYEQIRKSSTVSHNLTIIRNKIHESLAQIQLKKIIEDVDRDYLLIEETYNNLKIYFDKVKQHPAAFKNLQQLIESRRLNESKRKAFESYHIKYDELSVQANKYHADIEKLVKQKTILSDCTKYFTQKSLFDLSNLDAKILSVTGEIEKINRIDISLSTLDLTHFQLEDSLSENIEQRESLFELLKSNAAAVEESLKNMLNELNSFEKITKEINLLGRDYLFANPHSKDCPLCNTPLDEGELQRRITSFAGSSNPELNKSIELFNEHLKEISQSIEKVKEELTILNKVKVSYITLFPDKQIDVPITIVLKEIASFKSNLDDLNQRKAALLNLESIASSLNVSEDEFSYLSTKVKSEFNDLNFIYDEKDKFTDKLQEINNSVLSKRTALERISEDKLLLLNALKKEIVLAGELNNVDSIKKILDLEHKEILEVQSNFEKIMSLVNLQEDDLLEDIDSKFSILLKNISTLKKEHNNLFAVETAKKKAEDGKDYIKNNSAKFERFKKARETLESFSETEELKTLTEFFTENLVEIVDIFKTIHSPKEFINIEFVMGELVLNDSTQKKRKISEISTGQRSALALSIFISLNRKLTDGPNLIMFDDPVSYIDDFNALLFIDFLRYFVLKEKRQIFFATASVKLANLFEKKFLFLGDEFAVWLLSRSE